MRTIHQRTSRASRGAIGGWAAALTALVIGALLAVSSGPARAQPYQLTDLGSLGGVRGSGAYALNGGLVAGYSFISGSTFVHAMINDHGVVEDLGTLGGTQSLARAVNGSGWVVGWAYPPGVAWQRAFLWHENVMTDLGTFGGTTGDATDINDAGLVVGSAYTSDGNEEAFWWRDGVLHPMGTLGGSLSRALAVNQSGDIVGMSAIPGDDEYHAFLTKPGSPLYDLGTLGGPASHGIDINELVHVCGWSMLQENNPASRGFLWADGVMKSLGTLGGIYSSALGINDHDQIVGASTRADETQVAFLWSNDQMVDLNTLVNWDMTIPPSARLLLTAAYDIDNQGRIVGVGNYPNGETRAFMLLPGNVTGVSDAPRPGVTSFHGATPNPARGNSRFDFTLARAGRATLAVLDVSGRIVRTLADGEFAAGPQAIGWDGRDRSGARVAPGIYHARLVTAQATLTRRFAVVF
jgi:probable HAF family extracellular repeat protein